MAKRVIWSNLAAQDLKEITEFWNEKNKSTTFSKKLLKRVFRVVEHISQFPQSGQLSTKEGIRMKLLGYYYLVYEEQEGHIEIHALWDTRQNPLRLEERLLK